MMFLFSNVFPEFSNSDQKGQMTRETGTRGFEFEVSMLTDILFVCIL